MKTIRSHSLSWFWMWFFLLVFVGGSARAAVSEVSSLRLSTAYVASGTDSYVKLSWVNPAGAKQILVDRKPANSGSFARVATLNASAGHSYKNQHLKPGKAYKYRVRVKYAAATSAGKTAGITTAQGAVAQVVISPAGGSFQDSRTVTLSTATTGATIRYTLDGSKPTSASTQYGGTLSLINSCTLNARAFKSGFGDSVASAAVFTITSSVAKAGLIVKTLDSSRIKLAWLNTAAVQASGMTIKRSRLQFSGGTYSATAFSTVATTAAGETTFTDTGLVAGTLYFYQVRPTNNAETLSSASAATTSANPGSVPAAPTNLSVNPDAALSGETPQVLVLQFQRNSSNETHYVFETSSTDKDFALNGVVPLANLAAKGADLIGVDEALPVSTKYFYRVRALNSAGVSDPTEVASATTWASTVSTPTAPSAFTATATSFSTATLTWINTSTWDGYDLRGDSNSALLDNADHHRDIDNATVGNAPSVIVPVIQMLPATKYYFKVRVYRYVNGVATYSPFTSVISTTTQSENIVVTGVKFTNSSGYPIVSLIIDGVQKYPTAPQGLADSTNYVFTLSAGPHSYSAANGTWDGSSRNILYDYSGNFTVSSGLTTSIPLNYPPASKLMTRFSGSSKTWNGFYVGNASFLSNASIVFNTNGTCSIYTQDGTANPVLYGSGTYDYDGGYHAGTYIQYVGISFGGHTYQGILAEPHGSLGIKFPFSPYAVEYSAQ